MSCKSVGVSWSLLGSIFHNNSGHQLHRHLGDIQIWKSVAELCWVKCPPLEEESQSVFGTPLPPEYHIWATRSLRNNPECICLPVFNRTIRFQDNETVHVMCNTQSRKWGKKSAGNSDHRRRTAGLYTAAVSCLQQVDHILPTVRISPPTPKNFYFPYSEATSILLSGRKKSERQQLDGVASPREEMVSHEDYSILNDNWNQSTQLTKENRAPCDNVDWDFEKLYFEAVGRKEEKK